MDSAQARGASRRKGQSLFKVPTVILLPIHLVVTGCLVLGAVVAGAGTQAIAFRLGWMLLPFITYGLARGFPVATDRKLKSMPSAVMCFSILLAFFVYSHGPIRAQARQDKREQSQTDADFHERFETAVRDIVRESLEGGTRDLSDDRLAPAVELSGKVGLDPKAVKGMLRAVVPVLVDNAKSGDKAIQAEADLLNAGGTEPATLPDKASLNRRRAVVVHLIDLAEAAMAASDTVPESVSQAIAEQDIRLPDHIRQWIEQISRASAEKDQEEMNLVLRAARNHAARLDFLEAHWGRWACNAIGSVYFKSKDLTIGWEGLTRRQVECDSARYEFEQKSLQEHKP